MSAGTIGITEVAVGVPFPVAAIEICRYALGPATALAALSAEAIEVTGARAAGLIDEAVQPSAIKDRALGAAHHLAQHSRTAYEFTKRQLREPTLHAIAARK